MNFDEATAYHEAGHAVVAAKSVFNNVVSGIDTKPHGEGDIHLSVSISALKKAGKTSEFKKDKDVARDRIVPLVAGLMAEIMAEERGVAIKPNSGDGARTDYEDIATIQNDAGLSRKTDNAESDARATLDRNWETVEAIVSALRDGEGQISFHDLDLILETN